MVGPQGIGLDEPDRRLSKDCTEQQDAQEDATREAEHQHDHHIHHHKEQ
jgi:hypothetical protein